MPMRISSPDGTVLYIRTHCGDGITVIETWEEQPTQEPQPIDTNGDGDE